MAMPETERGPCQGPGAEDNTLCGETWSSCWYGKARQGVHFCSNHRAAWQQFRLNGATEEADEATVLTEVDDQSFWSRGMSMSPAASSRFCRCC